MTMPGIRRSASGMVLAPDASIISRSTLDIATGDLEGVCSSVSSDNTTGMSENASSAAYAAPILRIKYWKAITMQLRKLIMRPCALYNCRLNILWDILPSLAVWSQCHTLFQW